MKSHPEVLDELNPVLIDLGLYLRAAIKECLKIFVMYSINIGILSVKFNNVSGLVVGN